MKRFLRALQDWWQWRVDQGRTHILGIAEHTLVGTIVARDDQQWKVEDEQGRFVYAPPPCDNSPSPRTFKWATA